MSAPARAATMPAIEPHAWHGPIGASVCRIAATTEADPVAVLVSALAYFGALVGDWAYVRVGGVHHPARIWPLISGRSGDGRKGTSNAEAKWLVRGWGIYARTDLDTRLRAGLTSGEGLIGALGGDQGGPDKGEAREAAAPDGRMTVVETEFARVLAASKRDGSTLGPVLRQLWDDGDAAILTRAAPLTVRGAHLALIAHVTPRELRLRLAEADVAGGTLNRFLLVGSERPHLLPHEPPHPDCADLGRLVEDAIEHARSGGREVRRDATANELWTHVYAALSANEPDGMLGAVLARGPIYTMRLALCYALVDGCGAIGVEHLLAALAVWHYAAATARMLFADEREVSDGARIAGYLESAGAEGRTGTQISRYFRNHRSAAQLQAAMGQLEGRGQVKRLVEASKGRPTSRYVWTGGYRDPVLKILRAFEAKTAN